MSVLVSKLALLVYRCQTSFTRMFQRCCLATLSYTLLALQQPFTKRQYYIFALCLAALGTSSGTFCSLAFSFLEDRHIMSISFPSFLGEGSENIFHSLYSCFCLSTTSPEYDKIPQKFLFFCLYSYVLFEFQ